MATYRITAPDGGTYQITADTEEEAQSALSEVLGGGQAQPQQPLSGVDYVAGLADTAAQGLTLGFADEAAAAVQSALGRTPEGGFFDYGGDFGTRYEQNLARERQTQQQFARENPKTAFAAEVGGALLPTVAGAGVATGVRAAGNIAGRIAGAPLTTRRAAALGATEGGIYGFGSGEGGFGDRATSAFVGAPTGAVGGAVGQKFAAPAIEKTAKAIGRGARRAYTTLVDADPKMARGVKYVLDRARAAGISPSEMYQRVLKGEAVGQQDPLLMDLTRTISTERPDVGRKIIRDRLEAGFDENQDRILSETKRLLGGQDSYAEWLDDFKRTRGKNAKAAYDKVSERFETAGQAFELRELLPRIPAEALRSSRRLAQITGREFPSDLISVMEDGQVQFLRVPNIREAEMIRRGLKSATTKAFADGEGDIGIAIGGLEREFRDVLDKASPALKKARKAYADEMQIQEAAELGERLLNMSADQALFLLKDMNPVEKQAVRNAVAASVENLVERGQMNRDVIKRIYGTRRNRRILGELFGKQGDKFFREMEKLADFNALRTVVQGGSRTQQYLADARDFNEGSMIGLAIRATMDPQGAAAQAAESFLKSTIKAAQGMPDEAVEAAARLLTGEGPEVREMLRRAKLGNPKAVEAINRRVSRYLTQTGARPFLENIPAAVGAVVGGGTGQRFTTGDANR